MEFTPIDFQNRPRAQTFYYFSKMEPTGYSMTVNMDATTDGYHIKLFLESLQNDMNEFRLSEKEIK